MQDKLKGKINEKQAAIYIKKGLWNNKTLLDYWNEAVSARGNHIYITSDLGQTLSYSELDKKADVLAAWMSEMGIEAGDRVSVQITPRAEFVIILIACFKVGAVIVPFKMRFGISELAASLGMVNSKMHFFLEKYHNDDFYAFIKQCEKELPYEITNVIISDSETITGDEKNYLFGEILDNFEKNAVISLPRPDVTADDVAAILFTSGTTAGSRGAMLSHNNIISSESAFINTLHLTEEDTMFMPSPLSHAVGFHHGMIATMLYGGRLVLMDQYEKFRAMEIMDRENCTFTMGATPFVYDYIRCLDDGIQKPSRLKFFLCGGAPVPEALINKAFDLYNISICEVYGSTESVPHVLVPPEKAVEWKGAWSGIVLDGIEIRIVDENDNDVTVGEIGEELSRGPNTFLGYVGDQKTTDQVLDDEGWYHSGDLCYGDENGRIKICGRIKDMIIRGGENLNLNEIEKEMVGCPGLEACAVIGMPDLRLGERICVFVVSTDSSKPVTKEDLIAYMSQKKVSKWHMPEHVEQIDKLPYTDSGKIQRYKLKEELDRRLNLH